MLAFDEKFPDRDVCILGMGYVGLTLAAVMADVGFNVTGVEINDAVLASLQKGKPHFFEPTLDGLIKRLAASKKIQFTKYIPSPSRARVYIITVGTPLDPNGRVRLDMVEGVGREVGRHLKDGDLVILRSTVKIGTTRRVIQPILKETGVDFDLAFCPERTLEGQALTELRQLPQIVGGVDFRSAVRSSQIFQFLTPTVVRVSDVETAETNKLIDNAHRDVLFSYANEVARICDRVNISATEVIQSGKLGYPRTNVQIPGLVGGPCLEKDSHILAESVRGLGLKLPITSTARRLNEELPEEIVRHVIKTMKKYKNFPSRPVITLLGIAFKGRPATDDLRGTMARPVLKSLRAHFPKAIFRGYDPVVPRKNIQNFGLAPIGQLAGAFRHSHLIFILNNHVQLAAMPIEKYAGLMARPGLIYDVWNLFSTKTLHLPAGTGYMGLGSHGQACLPK